VSTPIDWDAATGEVVEHLRALIRIPSVNPPGVMDGSAGRDTIGAETAAARYCANVLEGAGNPAEVIEVQPGRGSCFARLRAAGPSPEPPLVLLSHIDVVPVQEDAWSRDPFGGELIDGVVWGRGAVDMKDMVAMELGVMLALQRSGAALRRDVIFAAVADEEAGGAAGAQALVRSHPQLFGSDASLASAAINEVGGYSMTLGGRRYYAIQVAEKGIMWSRVHATGTPGHGSMPHDDNATVHLADAISRLAADPRPARVHPVVAGFFEARGLGEVPRLAEGDPPAARAALEAAVDDPVLRRSFDAMLRDTVAPTILRAGNKVNVIPGRAMAELDVRTLPGTDQVALLEHLRGVAGTHVEVETVAALPPVVSAPDHPLVALMHDALRRADPEATPLSMMITPGTDAKALAELGIPTYGFAPLRLEADVPFLSLFHGHDERVSVSALRFGLPVLHEVVCRFVLAE
jgi:acetylornithine deacetylase/succinyl-diaminopimelate desuccinylase-like protein